ncbi:MAG: TetR/AcrR family transcriptional regulator [Eubacteriaceae bacterium]|nr:TetR/AcrR family transcriptional regulator [Eubacteriaceae bacterium]
MSIETFERLPEEKKELIIGTGIREFSRASYTDVSTDEVTAGCGISKGILFHYFGSKKNYYLYCLDRAMQRLVSGGEGEDGDDFYGVIFGAMEKRIEVCRRFPNETRMVNMASRDPSREIAPEKSELLGEYAGRIRAGSMRTVERAASHLGTGDPLRRKLVTEGLFMYVNAVINRYLASYLGEPDRFLEDAKAIEVEMKQYLDLMLYGILEGGDK